MGDKDQERPLAPAPVVRPSSDCEEAAPATAVQGKQFRRTAAVAAVILIIPAVTIVILIFTVFRIRRPDITLNGITVTQLPLEDGTLMPTRGRNISLLADVSVKNPNVASFNYDNTTTGIYYRGEAVGEARGPSGRARAGRTVRMTISVDILTDRILSRSTEVFSDLWSGVLAITSLSKVSGRVSVLRIVKKHVKVTVNCTITVNVTSRAIQDQKCSRKVDL